MTTALGQLATTFRLLTTGPGQPTITADVIGGRQHETITVAEFAHHLLDRSTTSSSRDVAWAYLVNQARTEGGQWIVMTAGIALPGLRTAATRVRHVWPHTDPDDAESEVLSGFIAALTTIDLDESHICARLCRGAYIAGRTWARKHIHTAKAVQRVFESHTPPRMYGHPDLVLAQAVHEDIISQTDARIIGATRLDHETRAKTAADVGCSIAELLVLRKRAELDLAEWIFS